MQLHNIEQLSEWTETLQTISGLVRGKFSIDLYVTVVSDTDAETVREKWMDLFNIKALDKCPNRGMDVGGFIWQFTRLMSDWTGHEYVAILKLHTKSDKNWRQKMVEPFLTSKLPEYINEMYTKNLGWVGARSFAWRREWKEQHITRDMERQAFGRITHPIERLFIAGTIFMHSFSLMLEMMRTPGLRSAITAVYTHSPIGRVNDSWPHAWERFFGIYGIVKQRKFKLI